MSFGFGLFRPKQLSEAAAAALFCLTFPSTIAILDHLGYQILPIIYIYIYTHTIIYMLYYIPYTSIIYSR